MRVNFSHDSKEFIFKLKSHISKNNPSRTKSYTIKLVFRIRDILQHPYIGKTNATFDDEREYQRIYSNLLNNKVLKIRISGV